MNRTRHLEPFRQEPLLLDSAVQMLSAAGRPDRRAAVERGQEMIEGAMAAIAGLQRVGRRPLGEIESLLSELVNHQATSSM